MKDKDQKNANAQDDFINPIDVDKVAENPHLLPYAHHVGSALIKPIDKGRIKGLALSAMYEQTDMQIDQIREQVELLMQQAQTIHQRVDLSEKIYQAKMSFKPLINETYHLYERENGDYTLSLIGPKEWGRSKPMNFLASVRLLADHTWSVLEGNVDL